jgi:guanine deaminase
VVFPAETRWSDPDWARRQTRSAFERFLEVGTLGLAGYLTCHRHGLEIVMKALGELPLRTLAGQVLMDRHAPGSLLGHAEAPLIDSPSGRFAATVNPRFAVACTDELLQRAADLAGDGAIIQTHLAETREECRLVGELFPHDPHYTGVYDRHGLLTERTLLAHCLHLAPEEWDLIAQRSCVVVHCPTANTFLKAGLFSYRDARDRQVPLALGSDVAAGPDLAMPQVARAMIDVAKHRAMTIDAGAPVPAPADVWDLITRGNACALGYADAGVLAESAAADLLVLEPPWPLDEHTVERLIYTWRNDYIVQRIVNGEVVGRSQGTKARRHGGTK